MSAALEELEDDFRATQRRSGAKVVILALQIEETAIRTLRPRLEASGVSLSELVREMLRSEARSIA